MSKKLPRVYISSPYSKGDLVGNVRVQMDAFHQLIKSKLVLPVAPLWSHFQHLVHPLSWKEWIDYDLALIEAGSFDACLRLPGADPSTPSSGADLEESVFHAMQLPVFYDLVSVKAWAAEKVIMEEVS